MANNNNINIYIGKVGQAYVDKEVSKKEYDDAVKNVLDIKYIIYLIDHNNTYEIEFAELNSTIYPLTEYSYIDKVNAALNQAREAASNAQTVYDSLNNKINQYSNANEISDQLSSLMSELVKNDNDGIYLNGGNVEQANETIANIERISAELTNIVNSASELLSKNIEEENNKEAIYQNYKSIFESYIPNIESYTHIDEEEQVEASLVNRLNVAIARLERAQDAIDVLNTTTITTQNALNEIVDEYTAAEANQYNYNLPGALQYGATKIAELESNSYEVVSDEASWNESYANGVLNKYYEKYPAEDLWNTIENRKATFNDRYYEGTIDNETVECNATWASDNAQKLIIGDNTYYGAIFYDLDLRDIELFTNVELTESADKTFNMASAYYKNCEHSYQGWIANGAQTPWICVNFLNEDVNAKLKFQYEGKEDVMPWNDATFGNGEGHKAWGIESLKQAFGDEATDISKFKLILVLNEPILYTNSEVDEYNASLEGAKHAGDPK